MPAGSTSAQLPPHFGRAVRALWAVPLRPEITLTELPPPQRLAPHSIAIGAEIGAPASAAGPVPSPGEVGHAEPLAVGRLIILHDPQGQEAWGGQTRLVAYIRAGIEPEMASDALLPSVCWLWLTEALAARSATYAVAGGTVTRLSSERFGTIATVAVEAAVELRASWTPLEPDLVPHLLAFADVLSRAAGLPPIEPGVVSLPKRRRRPS